MGLPLSVLHHGSLPPRPWRGTSRNVIFFTISPETIRPINQQCTKGCQLIVDSWMPAIFLFQFGFVLFIYLIIILIFSKIPNSIQPAGFWVVRLGFGLSLLFFYEKFYSHFFCTLTPTFLRAVRRCCFSFSEMFLRNRPKSRIDRTLVAKFTRSIFHVSLGLELAGGGILR